MITKNHLDIFPDQLHIHRVQKKWSQKVLADELGVSRMTVWRWEAGQAHPHGYYIDKLCVIFQCTRDEFGLTEETHEIIIDPLLPQKPEKLFGRETLIPTITSLLEQSSKTLAIQGLPGIGKTSLVSALAQEEPDVRRHFPDGVLWAGVGPHPDHHKLLERWAALLQIPPQPSLPDLIDRLKECMAKRRMLIILDDVWKVENTVLLQIGGHCCSYILTTRFPEIAVFMTTNNDHIIHLPELSNQESTQLLTHLVPEINGEDDLVISLIRSVGGLPLALILIGNYLRLQARSHRPRRLRDALNQLQLPKKRLELSPLSPHRSLKHILDELYAQLPEEVQSILQAMSVFPSKPNTIFEETIQTITHCSLEVLDLLYDIGLVESVDEERCSLHQVVADYAYVQINNEYKREVQINLIRYYTDFLQHHKQEHEYIEREYTNIQYMLETAYQLQCDLYPIVTSCIPYMLARGLYTTAEYHLQHLQPSIGETDVERHATICHFLGQVAQKQGDFHRAVEYFQTGLRAAKRVRNEPLTIGLITDLGWVEWKMGHYSQAEKALSEGLERVQTTPDRALHCKILRLLGSVSYSVGKLHIAMQFLQHALLIARQINDREQICIILLNLGSSDVLEPQQEINLLQEALRMARHLSHQEWICLACINLSDRYIWKKKYKVSKKLSKEGLQLARQMGHQEWIASSLTNLGIIAREQGAFKYANDSFQHALLIAKQLGRPYITGTILYEFSLSHMREDAFQQAKSLLDEMKQVLPPDDPNLTTYWQFGLAQLFAAQQDPQAEVMGRHCLQQFMTIGNKIGIAQTEQWLNHIDHIHKTTYIPP